MIWRLTYCNKDGVEARLDIIRGSSTPVEVIEGTDTPFVLNYKMDKPDKSGFFMTSSADISIFETSSFNIDSLKTSSEIEIKVEHYINDILDWSGFVIPDFFSKTIGSPATVEMVASDRLATLKGVTLTDLNQYISMRDLAVACLARTELSLPLYTLADFGNDGQTNAFFKALGLSGRLSDTKGRNISCYDILKSILVASNSKLVQQDGAWHIVNKWQHEQGAGNLFSNLTTSTPYSEQTINFSDVHVGGRRSIVPVAAITGVYHEFGGGRSYPDNFDFRDFGLIPEFNFPDWTKGGTFNVAMGSKEIIGYSLDGIMQFGTNTVDNYFFNSNVFNTSNYLQMDGVPVPYTTGQIEVVLDLNATAQTGLPFSTIFAPVTAVKIAVGAVKDGSPTIWLNNNGVFAENNAVVHNFDFGRGSPFEAQTKGFNLKGIINNPEGYSIIMRIYGSRDGGEDNKREVAIHFAKITFKSTQDAPKGTIYKRRQGTGFTKEHEIDTTIFGDYMQKGLDGYFYEYPLDDTSSLYSIAGTLTQPLWTAPNDTEQLPLLHHVTRQKSRMFSLAHNMISARIDASSFKPLSIFIDCNSERYVVVSATYDFLRSEVEVELEQIAYATLNVRDFIYSYFGDGEGGISSVGGVSGGGGGGLTADQIELIGGIKEKVDEVEERVNNSRVGVANLLRNTGFLGDFQPLNVDNLTALENSSPIDTNPLEYWIHSNTSVIDAPSRSGKGVRIGSIQQNVVLKIGEPYVLSFWAKGTSLIVELVDTIEIPLTSEYKRYSFDIVASETKEYTFTLIDNGNTAEVYEIMLSNGNAKVSYSYAEEDDVKAISQIQAINTITAAIKTGKTEILGGLILSTMIQLGKYKDDVMEKVTSGINGIYNNDNDPAIWAGGSFDDAIRTVQRLIDNPNNEPTQAEWAEMANIVMTHGGDGFFKGYIYALGGIFRGRIESNVGGNRVIIDPVTRTLRIINSQGLLLTQMSASDAIGDNYSMITMNFYGLDDVRRRTLTVNGLSGIRLSEYAEDGETPTKHILFGYESIIHEGLPVVTGTPPQGSLAPFQLYYDENGFVRYMKPE